MPVAGIARTDTSFRNRESSVPSRHCGHQSRVGSSFGGRNVPRSTSPTLLGEAAARAVTTAWFGPGVDDVTPLSAGGFSGAVPWRVRTASRGCFVLKKLPARSGPEAAMQSARWLHELIRHGRAGGVPELPDLAATLSGDTWVRDGTGAVWEMARFVEGEATDTPSLERAVSALELLARLHAVWAGAPRCPPHPGFSPALGRRIDLARRLLADPWRVRRRRLAAATGSPRLAQPDRSLRDAVIVRWDRAIDLFDRHDGSRGLGRLAGVEMRPSILQAVVRDVWSDHVLYQPGVSARVAGLIDLHAAGIDSVMVDFARLAGSWRRSPWGGEVSPRFAARLAAAAEAYPRHPPLDDDERQLLPWLHAGGVLGGLDHWFTWVVEEQRSFPDPTRVIQRVDHLLDQWPETLTWLAGGGESPV